MGSSTSLTRTPTTSQDGDFCKVELVFNELSIHGQFHDPASFRNAIGSVLKIRNSARRFGKDIQCHRNLVERPAMGTSKIIEVIRYLDRDSQRALMQWSQRYGPFWDDLREHMGDDWLEYDGEIVTDTAVGEAAYCVLRGIERALISIDPSSWLVSPLLIHWRDNDFTKKVEVSNYWTVDKLERALTNAPSSLNSWRELATAASLRYPHLTFSTNCFEPLDGYPFGQGTADRLLSKLGVLNHMKDCFNHHGKRTPEGHTLYQKHFTGDKAWFSDSSDTERARFKNELTFKHPANPNKVLFCPWHGKVKTPQLRIHFSWPIRADEPLYVVYVGPKITKG